MVENRRVGHQEPRGLRVPGRPGPHPWPTRTWRASPSSATWPTRRPAWSPAGPSWSTTACGSRPSRRPSTPSSTRARRYVTGDVRLRCEPGRCTVVGRRSDVGLYDHGLATYDAADTLPPRGRGRLRPPLGPRACRRGPAARCAGRTPATRPMTAALMTLWQGRLDADAADGLMAFTASLPFDVRLAADDVAGSKAHVRGLRAGRAADRRGGRRRPRGPRHRRRGAGGGHVPLRARRRGRPHRRRAPGHRAGRAGGGQAPHRPQPQRPGRHRPAAVDQAGAGRRWPGRWSPCSGSC